VVRLFKVSIPTSVITLMVSETVLLFCCYVVAAYWTTDLSTETFLLDDNGLWRIALVVATVVMGLYFSDLYEDFRIKSRVLLVQQTSVMLGIAFVLQAVLNYWRSDFLLSKWTMVYGSALVLVMLPAWRIFFVRVVSRVLGSQGLLFLGSSQAVREIIAQLAERPDLGLRAIGYLETTDHKAEKRSLRAGAGDPLIGTYGGTIAPLATSSETTSSEICGIPALGTIDDLDAVIAAKRPDRIVVGMTERRKRLPVEQLLHLRFSGIQIEEAAATFEHVFHRVSVRDLRPSQLIFSAELGPRPRSVALQGVYSWILGAILLVLALPLMALVALLVKITSPGPSLFRQTRVGLNGATFSVFKFRSMYKDAEAHTGAVWAVRDDPRVTPLGRWLRRLRLDELPQLFNVVRGEMSLVGPRPERPEFVKILQEKIPYYAQRNCVKPGITGWAQINHKYGDTIEDSLIKFEFDLYYIKNLAVSLDAYIVFHTIKIMLSGRGAQ
jgi:lipopolysaccharide/colanic/teichoic acid biosynthesis glycosyltransferase